MKETLISFRQISSRYDSIHHSLILHNDLLFAHTHTHPHYIPICTYYRGIKNLNAEIKKKSKHQHHPLNSWHETRIEWSVLPIQVHRITWNGRQMYQWICLSQFDLIHTKRLTHSTRSGVLQDEENQLSTCQSHMLYIHIAYRYIFYTNFLPVTSSHSAFFLLFLFFAVSLYMEKWTYVFRLWHFT